MPEVNDAQITSTNDLQTNQSCQNNTAAPKNCASPAIDKPLLRPSTTFYDQIITDWWWWELGSWLLSFACVAAIAGVLWYHDGKLQPEHLFAGITLNAFIAIFAAVSKAALILPVSEAIGQLKWMWFQKDVKLWDFQIFDAASRGPWGSFMLLIRIRTQ